MAAVMSKSNYTAPHNLASQRTQTVTAHSTYSAAYVSPTDSDFSVAYDDPDSVRSWDEQRVGDWLKSINAAQYVDIFKANNITGENLIDLDQKLLKEIGVNKIGDRVRIGAQAKVFRHQEYRRKRPGNRDSLTVFDSTLHTPPSSASPRPTRIARTIPSARPEKRSDIPIIQYATAQPVSPPVVDSARLIQSNKISPGKPVKRDLIRPQLNQTISAPSIGQKEIPTIARPSTLARTTTATTETLPQAVRPSQASNSPRSVDGASSSGQDRQWIRVVYDDSRISVFRTEDCHTAEQVILKTLKKGKLNETHVKSYCFYLLDGTEANPAYCRRLSDTELMRVCADTTRKQRERLLFRKIHGGEPEGEQLTIAANFALQELQQAQLNQAQSQPVVKHVGSHAKLQKLTGEALPSLAYPMSPAAAAQRGRPLTEAERKLQQSHESLSVPPRVRPRQQTEFPRGERPPSELVVADTDTYFPDQKDAIATIRRMSVRRSQRLSRAQNRLSVASNISGTSSTKDAPPVPGIPQNWLSASNAQPRARPLSIFGRSAANSMYRDSIALSTLDALDEESPFEPDRQSYIAFDAASISVTDVDGYTVSKDESTTGSGSSVTDADSSINEQLSQVIAEDGEEEDSELNAFLKPDAWEDIKYIRGKLIGQGSFGSVYLALHAVTAELMAVKQVELPSTAGTALDVRKNNMVAALKHEIALLRELRHPHIVQYLGSSSDANNLNIFLEYIPGGSIAKMLIDYGSLNENLVANFVRQILSGLAYLHSKDIIHRDIKGANVLVDNHGSVKISDFGISKRVQDSKSLMLSPDSPSGSSSPSSTSSPAGTTVTTSGITNRTVNPVRAAAVAANRVSLQGSVFWMAPEVVRQTTYTRKADIWSLGCLIVEMLTGAHPHPTLSQLQAIFKIGGRGVAGAVNDPAPEVPRGVGEDCKEFLKCTFRVEWEERPEAVELMGFRWLASKAMT